MTDRDVVSLAGWVVLIIALVIIGAAIIRRRK